MSKDQKLPEMATPPNDLDLNELEKVFGTPASPKKDRPSDVHIVNELRQAKDQVLNNNNEKNGTNNNMKTEDVELLPQSQPLLEPEKGRQLPPLSGPEVDDLGEKPATNTPFNGIDDGLLEPEQKKADGQDSEGDSVHKSGEGVHSRGEGGADAGPEDGKWPWSEHDEIDYPYDGYNGVDTRFGVDNRPISPMPGSIPDVNTYQQKKNLAQGMMDLALLSANANQLRYVLESSSAGHPYYYSSLVFISLSIIFQVAVGVGLIMNSRYNVKDDKDICKADKINNMTVLGVFLITIVNVFITAFSVAPSNSVATVSNNQLVQQGG